MKENSYNWGLERTDPGKNNTHKNTDYILKWIGVGLAIGFLSLILAAVLITVSDVVFAVFSVLNVAMAIWVIHGMKWRKSIKYIVGIVSLSLSIFGSGITMLVLYWLMKRSNREGKLTKTPQRDQTQQGSLTGHNRKDESLHRNPPKGTITNKGKQKNPASASLDVQKTPDYAALGSYLSRVQGDSISFRFKEIEQILRTSLPNSARKYRSWWGNTTNHPHAVKGWLDVGWKVDAVDLSREIVRFTKVEQEKITKPPSLPRRSVSSFPQLLNELYEPLELLGEGGFAKVFKVKRRKDGKIVALKIPRIDERTSKTFLREVSTWFQLDHLNIVKLYDADILPVPYLEMEFVEGTEVNGKLVRDLGDYPKPVAEGTALRLIRGIAAGLKHAHSKGIYHRDLKPQNILLKPDLTPKITDWGLAKLGTMSSGRSVMGYTPLYAAPEHLMPGRYGHTDARTDVWQLGVVFYELLTGRLPFEGYTGEEVYGKITDESYHFEPPSRINPALAKYDGIFERLLAKRKEERYGSVEEFLEDLKRLGEVEKRKAELEDEIEELKRTLAMSIEALKRSRSAEEALRNRRMVVESLGKLALTYAELNRKADLLNTLNDLKFYTVQNLNDLSNAINTVELLVKENVPVGEDLMERLKVLVHKIKRENGV